MANLRIHYNNNNNCYLEHDIAIIVDENQKVIVGKGKTSDNIDINPGQHTLKVFYSPGHKVFFEQQIEINEENNYYVYTEPTKISNGVYKQGSLSKVADLESAEKNDKKPMGIITVTLLFFLIIIAFIIKEIW